MHANNETGVIFPVSEIGGIARRHEIVFFTDATQTAGKLPVDFTSCNIDIAAFSSHKMFGPKGAAALYIAGDELKRSISPLIHGGGQERNIRSGTNNVPAIVGFGEACKIAEQEMMSDGEKNGLLRELWEQEIMSGTGNVSVNGQGNPRLPHVSNMSFRGIEARELIRRINTVAVSSTSACSSGSSEMSHVLKAMGKCEDSIRGAVRFSCGRFSTDAEIHYAINEFQKTLGERKS
jgi:cysteine desulfurase